MEFRGVETIEEFFRPEFAHNTQSLGNINDDSDINEDLEDGEERHRVKLSDDAVSKEDEDADAEEGKE